MLGKEVGSYRIQKKIGQGGMGIVYKAIHTKLEQEVAIKVLHPQFSQDPQMRKRFIKEAKIQARFTHPNVVNILNYLEDESDIFLVMEYVNGETLENRLKRDGDLKIEKAVSMSLSVLEALNFMHSEGVIHRDIKPSNIMFTEDGVVKVTDFGIAKVVGEKSQTRTGMVGTFRYMSPEQILGEDTTIATDIYSFGITLYEMVTGTVPFSGDSEYKTMKGHLEEMPTPPWEINRNVSKKLGRVILKTLSKDPKDRHQKVGELEEDIRTAINKSKGAKVFHKLMNSALGEIPSLNLTKNRLLLLPVAVILLFVFLWLAQRPGDFISTASTSTVAEPDADSYRADESNLMDLGPSTAWQRGFEESLRLESQPDEIAETEQTDKGGEATTKTDTPFDINTESRELPQKTTDELAPDAKVTKNKKEKKVEQSPGHRIKKEKILFPEQELQKGSKWKIRK